MVIIMILVLNKKMAKLMLKVTGYVFVIENDKTKEIMFTNAAYLPEKPCNIPNAVPVDYTADKGYTAIAYQLPIDIQVTDPKEHHSIKTIERFLDYYYGDYTLIENVG